MYQELTFNRVPMNWWTLLSKHKRKEVYRQDFLGWRDDLNKLKEKLPHWWVQKEGQPIGIVIGAARYLRKHWGKTMCLDRSCFSPLLDALSPSIYGSGSDNNWDRDRGIGVIRSRGLPDVEWIFFRMSGLETWQEMTVIQFHPASAIQLSEDLSYIKKPLLPKYVRSKGRNKAKRSR